MTLVGRCSPGYKESSDAFIDANIQLALVAARKVTAAGCQRAQLQLLSMLCAGNYWRAMTIQWG